MSEEVSAPPDVEESSVTEAVAQTEVDSTTPVESSVSEEEPSASQEDEIVEKQDTLQEEASSELAEVVESEGESSPQQQESSEANADQSEEFEVEVDQAEVEVDQAEGQGEQATVTEESEIAQEESNSVEEDESGSIQTGPVQHSENKVFTSATSTEEVKSTGGEESTEYLASSDKVKEKDVMHFKEDTDEAALTKAVEELRRQIKESVNGVDMRSDPLLCTAAITNMKIGVFCSEYAKKIKSFYLLKKGEGEKWTRVWSYPQARYVHNQVNELALCKLQQSVHSSPYKDLIARCLKYPSMSITIESEASAGESGPPPDRLELAYFWSNSLFRYGKSLQQQALLPQAFSHYACTAKLMQTIIEEDFQRKWTASAFQKLPKVLEKLATVRPSDSELRTYCDSFLVQFSNIAMRGEIKDLSLKPLIALCLSENRYIRASNPVDVVRHLATFFETPIAEEASKQLEYLESIMKRTEDKEAELDRVLSAEAKKRLAESGLTKEEIMEHTDVLINLLRWKGKPPPRLPFDPVPFDPDFEPDREFVWILENPRRAFVDRYKLSSDEGTNPDANVYLAKRKSDGLPVSIKVMKRYSKNEKAIKKEIEWLRSLRFEVFAHLLDVYLFNDEVWVVMEYCNGGNLVDLLPVKAMPEPMIAYIAKQVLRGLAYLHERDRMHRDLTSDDILMNLDGEVLLVDFEIWLDNSSQRYWLPPELLLCEAFPYGAEVDIWSLGCIVIEIADGRPPYSDLHPLKEFFLTATRGAPRLKRPLQWSPHMSSFLDEALNPDPLQRATAKQLLEHPLIQSACTQEEFATCVAQRVSFTKW